MLRFSFVVAALVSVAGLSAGGCRSCSSCHDYDPPVANCQCGSCGEPCGCGSCGNGGCSTCGCSGGACSNGGCSNCGCAGGNCSNGGCTSCGNGNPGQPVNVKAAYAQKMPGSPQDRGNQPDLTSESAQQ
jgi:hypothetical protein